MELGFVVTGVDLSEQLLTEAAQHRGESQATTGTVTRTREGWNLSRSYHVGGHKGR
jgi:2-polyprenyl-3-methyl-5-hydroxy-6-metoxy-1,4-benzoquinol methylase